MSEHEKRLREWMRATPGGPLSHELAAQALDAALSAARDAALEEAERRTEALASECAGHSPVSASAFSSAADAIRALKSCFAERYLPEAKVREVLRTARSTLLQQGYGAGIIHDISKRLGVDLDAKGEAPPISGPALVPFCPKCHHPAHLSACVNRNGGSANPCPCLYTSLPARVAASKAKTECEGSPDCGWHNGGPCAACKAKEGTP